MEHLKVKRVRSKNSKSLKRVVSVHIRTVNVSALLTQSCKKNV